MPSSCASAQRTRRAASRRRPGRLDPLARTRRPRRSRSTRGSRRGWSSAATTTRLLAKVLVVGTATAHGAIARARRALGELETGGVQTTLPFHAWLLAHPDFVEGRLRTDLVDRDWMPTPRHAMAVLAGQRGGGTGRRRWSVATAAGTARRRTRWCPTDPPSPAVRPWRPRTRQMQRTAGRPPPGGKPRSAGRERGALRTRRQSASTTTWSSSWCQVTRPLATG